MKAIEVAKLKQFQDILARHGISNLHRNIPKEEMQIKVQMELITTVVIQIMEILFGAILSVRVLDLNIVTHYPILISLLRLKHAHAQIIQQINWKEKQKPYQNVSTHVLEIISALSSFTILKTIAAIYTPKIVLVIQIQVLPK